VESPPCTAARSERPIELQETARWLVSTCWLSHDMSVIPWAVEQSVLQHARHGTGEEAGRQGLVVRLSIVAGRLHYRPTVMDSALS
jgi:hypothetical protein